MGNFPARPVETDPTWLPSLRFGATDCAASVQECQDGRLRRSGVLPQCSKTGYPERISHTLKGRRASCPRRLGRLDKQPYGQTAGALRERTSRARVRCCAASQAARAPGALTLVRRRQTRTTIARGGAALSGPSRPPPDWAKPPPQPPPELPELRRRRARRPPPARPRHPRCSAAADP